MASGVTFKIEGLAETEKALAELGKALGKAVLRRVGVKAMTPMRDEARRLAPDDPETGASIAQTIIISTTAPIGEKSAAARAFAISGGGAAGRAAAKAAGSGAVRVWMGPGRHPKVYQQEFGNVNHGPQPYMRPALDQHKESAMRIVGSEMWGEIQKAAARRARKAAKK